MDLLWFLLYLFSGTSCFYTYYVSVFSSSWVLEVYKQKLVDQQFTGDKNYIFFNWYEYLAVFDIKVPNMTQKTGDAFLSKAQWSSKIHCKQNREKVHKLHH